MATGSLWLQEEPHCDAIQANDAVWRRREPSREARTPCENGRWTSRASAGDQGCARTALRLVQRRTEEVRGRAEDRPHGRDVTGAGVRPRARQETPPSDVQEIMEP